MHSADQWHRRRAFQHLAFCAVAVGLVVSSRSPAATVPSPTPTPSQLRAVFGYESDPGEWLGGGQTKVLTDADGQFTVTHEPGFVEIDFFGPIVDGVFPNWTLMFQAPRGSDLVPGLYEDASNEAPPRKPGLNVLGDGSFCDVVVGWFSVLEAAYAPSGDVERLAINFELRCEDGDRIFFGYVRINSDWPPPVARTPTPTPRRDQAVLVLNGQPGSVVGPGQSIYTAQDRKFGSQWGWYESRQAVDIQVIHGETALDWQLTFAAPFCTNLVPGVYEGAIQVPWMVAANPWEALTSPALDIRSGIFFCEGLTGRFVVREAQYDAYGRMFRFAADFKQQCSGMSLFGSIFYTSGRPSPTPAPPTPTPTDYSSLATLYTQPGDYIGYCTSQYLTLAEGDFSASYEPGHVNVVFEGGPNWWTFDFSALPGRELVPGAYRQAMRYPPYPGQPGLTVSGQGRGCNTLTGQFTVYEADFGNNGEVRRFAADFAQHCEGAGAALYGTVRYHSSLPPPTWNPLNAPTPTPPLPACRGDCSGDGTVTVDELILVANIALGLEPVDSCRKSDGNHDGKVTIDELMLAVDAALEGCDRNSPT